MLHLAQKTLPEGPGSQQAARKVQRLNTRLKHHGAWDVLNTAFDEIGDLALVSSFGAESVVLLHLAAMVNRDVPVIFIDTEMLFTETLVYQQELAERLRLRDMRIIRADDIEARDPSSSLHRRNPDACCALRKIAPLRRALEDHGGWITGRKRYQSAGRDAIAFFEHDPATAKIKVNPLARWSRHDITTYMDENRLPRHPLVAKGYPSIGCAPCTSPVQPGEDARAGRWRGTAKDECGIHFSNGKAVRTGAQK